MTSTGKTIYTISITDSQGRMQSYRIAASAKALAEGEAQRLASVPDTTESSTCQNSGRIDSEV